MKYFFIIVSILILQKGYSCDCPPTSVERDYITSDFIGVGVITNIQTFDSISFKISISLKTIFKGEKLSSLLSIDWNKSSCGQKMSLNERWIFFADSTNGLYHINSCKSTMHFAELESREIDFLENPSVELLGNVVFEHYEMDEQPELSEIDLNRISKGFKSNQGATGKIYVLFTVSNEGFPKDPEIIARENEELYEEAIQIVMNLENIKPGRVKGQDVSGRLLVSIKFN